VVRLGETFRRRHVRAGRTVPVTPPRPTR